MEIINLLKHGISEVSTARVDTEMTKALHTDGAIVIPNFLPRDECDRLASDFESQLSNPGIKIWRDEIGSDQRIFGINNLSKSFAHLYLNQKLLQEHENYLGARVRAGFAMCNKTIFKLGNKGSGSGWHRDSPFTHQFKAIVYLSDVTEENGPFEYLPSTHLVNSIRECCKIMNIDTSTYRFEETQVSKLLESKFKKITVTGKKGDMILVDTKTIHRGSPINSGERLAVTNYYFKSEMPKQFHELLN